MKRCIFFLGILLYCCGCHVSRMPENVQVLGRFMTFKDSGETERKVQVYTDISCENLKFINKQGYVILRAEEGKAADSSCFVCNEITGEEGKGIMIMNQIDFEGERYDFWINMEGQITIHNSSCQKYIINVRGKWKDSIPVLSWHEVKKDSGMLVFYAAEEQYGYPYYKKDNMDSFRFDLHHFCTQEDTREEVKTYQEVFDKYMKVKVTPNPFTDNFELILSKDPIGIFNYRCGGAQLKISFYDDQGNFLSSKHIEPEVNYNFSFPAIAPGKTIFYRITWDEYVLGGQVMKV